MSSSRKNWLVLLSVGLFVAGFVIFYLKQFGWQDENLQALLRERRSVGLSMAAIHITAAAIFIRLTAYFATRRRKSRLA